MDHRVRAASDLDDFDADASQGRNMLGVVYRRQWIVVFALTLSLAIGCFHFAKSPPVYESAAKVLVKTVTPAGIQNDNLTGPTDARRVLGNRSALATQMTLICSPLVVQPAVDDLSNAHSKPFPKDLLAQNDQKLGHQDAVAGKDASGQRSQSLVTLRSLANLGDPAATVLGGLSVKQEEESDVLLLSYRGPVAKDCQIILDAVVQSYKKYLKGTRDSVTKETATLIKKAKDELSQDLAHIERSFSDFRRVNAHLLFKVAEGKNVHQARQIDIEDARSKIILERSQTLAQLNAIKTAVQGGVDRDALLLLIQNDPQETILHPTDRRLVQVGKQLTRVEAEIAEKDARIRDTRDRLSEIDDQFKLTEQTQQKINRFESRLAQLESQLEQTQKRIDVVEVLHAKLQNPNASNVSLSVELLPLLQEEQNLLDRYGPDHPSVISVRKRMELTREILQDTKVEEQRADLGAQLATLKEKRAAITYERDVTNDDLQIARKEYPALLSERTASQDERPKLKALLAELGQDLDALRKDRDRLRMERQKLEYHPLATIEEPAASTENHISPDSRFKVRPDSVIPKDKLDVYIESLEQRISTVDTRAKELDALFTAEQEKAKGLESLEAADKSFRSEIARKQQLFDVVIKRLEEINLTEHLGGFDATVVSEPSQASQVEPVLLRILAIAGLLGSMAGIGLAYVIDLADKRFRNPNDIRNDLGVPLLGHIPMKTIKQQPSDSALDSSLYVYHKPKSTIAECYRSIRTSLYFNSAGSGQNGVNNLKIIQITSPSPGDGKTTLASNLAISIAQSGKNVLLLDADFRKPRVHRLLGLEQETGLSSVMAGNTMLRDAIQTCKIEKLFVLPCGPIPSNPAELLSSQKMQSLFDQLREQQKLDYVIVDSPPLLVVTDPSNVAPRVDGVLLVIRITRHARANAIRAMEILTSLGAPTLGVVVNGVGGKRSGGFRSGKYQYAYSYRNYNYNSYGNTYGVSTDGYTDDSEESRSSNGSADVARSKNIRTGSAQQA